MIVLEIQTFGMDVNERMRRSLFGTTKQGIGELSNGFSKNFISPSLFFGNVVSKAPQWTDLSWGAENKLYNKAKESYNELNNKVWNYYMRPFYFGY